MTFNKNIYLCISRRVRCVLDITRNCIYVWTFFAAFFCQSNSTKSASAVISSYPAELIEVICAVSAASNIKRIRPAVMMKGIMDNLMLSHTKTRSSGGRPNMWKNTFFLLSPVAACLTAHAKCLISCRSFSITFASLLCFFFAWDETLLTFISYMLYLMRRTSKSLQISQRYLFFWCCDIFSNMLWRR